MNVYLYTKITLDVLYCVNKNIKITKYTKKYKSVENNKINFYSIICCPFVIIIRYMYMYIYVTK